MNLAVLMTCHNRRETTLRCLRTLHAAARQTEGKDGNGQLTVDVFLVDDGSTDGTGEAVRRYAEKENGGEGQGLTVHLIQGDGMLYWAKGMAFAWSQALECEKRIDYSPAPSPCTFFTHFLWLNDDVDLDADALVRAFEAERTVRRAAPAVVVGELVDVGGRIVYGKRGDLFTGNFVLLPRRVYERVGMICGDFCHAWADSDYAQRCRRAKIPVVSCGVVGRCEGHENRPSLAGLTLAQRWAMLWHPKGWCVKDLWLYRRRNWGYCAAVASCLHLMIRVIRGTGRILSGSESCA